MSTYSSLKFELILTGDQSGQWGNTTNTNIGTAVEQAIVGMATLTSADFPSNVATLTLADTNAAQNARALCLNIAAGAVSTAGTINVPAIQKPYIIINGSSHTVTVKVSGLTGVAVPSGKRTVVYNNGTDVGNQVDYLPALALGTALPVASGGTGVTTSTGTGAVVLSTSPTLVTPLLGTPTSGNLANCTFPTLNQNTTGYAAGIAGGAANRIAYQSGANTTTFVAAPTVASTYLSWTGSAFTWTAVSPGSITGGLANQIVYQSAPSTSTFVSAPTTASTYLSWNGSTFVWTSVSPAGSTFAGDISVNGLTVGRGTASIASNTALGYQANNAITTATGITSVGYNANAGITTSIQHTAVGYEANKTITDVGGVGFEWEGNTAVGFKALTLNAGYISAYSANTAVGAAAGAGLVGGYYNTSIGAGAGPTGLGANSVCVGIKAGYSWAGTESVLIGYQAYGQVSGSTNVGNYVTVIGASTLYNALQGSSGKTVNYVTAVGRQTFYNLDPSGGANCASNTALGAQAGSSLLDGVNNILLGYNAQASATSVSNEITLGNSSIATLRCQVTSITALSDARDKYDIEDLPVGLDFINSLKARRFKWDKRDAYFDEVESESGPPTKVAVPKDGSRKSDEWNEGFIAQEVDEAATAAGADWMNLVYKSNPEKLEMTPGKLIPVLVKAIQELTARLEALEARN